MEGVRLDVLLYVIKCPYLCFCLRGTIFIETTGRL